VFAESDIFSINFYKDDPASLTTTVQENQAAGMGDWLTTGWVNSQMHHNTVGGLPAETITSSGGSTATYHLLNARNGSPYGGERTVMLGDGTADMMDGHVHATEDLNGSDNAIFDVDILDIPFDTYEVIVYMGGSDNGGDLKGKFVINDGPEQTFQVMPARFDGTFVEIINDENPGNYFTFTGTGTSFNVKVWGNGFNHLGPCGIQFRNGDPNLPDVDAGPDKITLSGMPVPLDATVVNNDVNEPQGNITLLWTADPPDGVAFDSNSIEDPTVTITHPAPENPSTVTLILTATLEGVGVTGDSMTINVYDDACLAAKAANPDVIDLVDTNKDCITNLQDYAVVAKDWLFDYAIKEPKPKP
jgi:hypothetical protein